MRVREQVGSTAASNKADTGDSDSRAASRRRSSRVVIHIPITLFGQDTDHKMFHETTKTITVSAHGALINVKSNIDAERPVLMLNPKTGVEAECRVAYRKDVVGGGAQIGLEFSNPLPKFWGIHFPPDDWDPAERKRPTLSQGPVSVSPQGKSR
jgi:hypothetical protein